MIATVILQGFQSHIDSYFDLCGGLNVITGPSDSGKTSIFRAIRWVAYGEPSGEAFMNPLVGHTTVKIIMDNGIAITKTRTRGKTAYALEIPGQKASVFEKAEVPEEVTAVLGLAKQSFGDYETTLNFAYQLDSPFLLSEPASVGAKILGKLSGTEIVDKALKAVSKDNYKANADKLQAIKAIDSINEQLEEYKDVEELRKVIAVCEKDLNSLVKMQEAHTKLVPLYKAYTQLALKKAEAETKLIDLSAILRVKRTLEEYDEKFSDLTAIQKLYKQSTSVSLLLQDANKKAERLVHLPVAGEDIKVLGSQMERYSQLISLQSKYKKQQQLLEQAAALMEKTKQLPEARELLRQVAASFSEVKKLEELYNQYTEKRSTLYYAEENLFQAESAVMYNQSELKLLWHKLKVCPLCEQPTGGHDGH